MTAARMLLGTLITAGLLAAAEPAAKLPFVYTKWKHFTVENGLPNDHIFAVKADGPRVWVGTENGLLFSTSAQARSRAGRKRTVCPGVWSPASI